MNIDIIRKTRKMKEKNDNQIECGRNKGRFSF